MKKLLVILLALLLVLAGCSSNEEKEDPKDDNPPVISQQVTYGVMVNGKEVLIDDEFDKELFGQENSVFELTNCAIGDSVEVYTYDEFEVNVYKDETGKQRVLSFYILDANFAGFKGLCLGDDANKVVEQLGQPTSHEGSLYSYISGKTNVDVIVENDAVVSIEISLIY